MYVHYMPSFSFNIDPHIYDEWARHVINNEIKQIKTPIDQTELLLSFWNELELHIEATVEIIKSYNFKKITIIADISQKLTCDNINNVDVIYMNIWPLVTRNFQHRSLSNPTWMPQLTQGLFLAGADPRRKNRIGLLKKLFDKEILKDNIVWTCPFLKEYHSTLINFFPGIDTAEFDNFINYCDQYASVVPGFYIDYNKEGNVDDQVQHNFYEGDSLVYLYKQTNFSIVAETFYNDYPANKSAFLTEKTYRVIYNKHPFILVAPPGFLAALKEIGFKTFENYLPQSDYDTILDSDQRLDAIANNVAAFPEAIIKYQDDINDDIEYNYALMNQIISNELKNINDLCTDKKISIDQIEFCSPLSWPKIKQYTSKISEFNNQHQMLISERRKNYNINLFIKNYNIVKTNDWPDITNIEDFYNLPQQIQTECKNVFGLDPQSI